MSGRFSMPRLILSSVTLMASSWSLVRVFFGVGLGLTFPVEVVVSASSGIDLGAMVEVLGLL